MSDYEPEPTVAALFDLTGRVAIVTGGTGHLGSSMSRALAEAGAIVVPTSRDGRKAQAFAESLPGVGHFGVALDHMKTDSLEDAFASIVAKTGRVDVLVNNAHEATSADWSEVSAEEFNRQLANATGYFQLAKLLRDHAVARSAPASVVMLASMYGLAGSYPDAYEGICAASPVAYQTLKGGVIQMTRHLAAYWARDGVRVNCLSPGPFPGPSAPDELIERLKGKLPMMRMGRPFELKGAVVFLASDAGGFMTGQNLVIDGGWTAW